MREVSVGKLSVRRDFTDVRDVVRAYRLLLERGDAGEIYNVCSGVDVSIADLADRLREHIYPHAVFVEDPGLSRPQDVPVLRGDLSRLHAATGGRPPSRSRPRSATSSKRRWRTPEPPPGAR